MRMDTDFTARPGVALVTGGTGGIGQAIVRMLVERGSRVAMTYHRNREAAERICAGAGKGNVTATQLDLCSNDAVEHFVQDSVREHGGVHTLIYASGPHVPMVHLSKVSAAEFGEQLQSDALAFFTVAAATLPALRETKGSIVAVTTAATRRFPVRDGLSSAPKGAVEATVRAFAAEEGRFGVRVNTVGPGMLTDGMAERLISSGDLAEDALEVARRNIPLRRFGRATDIAEAVCFLASERAGFISGQHLDVDGGYGV